MSSLLVSMCRKENEQGGFSADIQFHKSLDEVKDFTYWYELFVCLDFDDLDEEVYVHPFIAGEQIPFINMIWGMFINDLDPDTVTRNILEHANYHPDDIMEFQARVKEIAVLEALVTYYLNQCPTNSGLYVKGDFDPNKITKSMRDGVFFYSTGWGWRLRKNWQIELEKRKDGVHYEH